MCVLLLGACCSSEDRDVAQLVEHQTSMQLGQVKSPVQQEIFLSESTFSADSLSVSAKPPLAATLLLDTQKYCTLLGMSTAALVTAVALPGKVT